MGRLAANMRVWPLFLLAVVMPVSVSAGGIAAGLVMATALGLLLWKRDLSLLPPSPVLLAVGLFFLAPILAAAFSAPYPSNWNKVVEESWLKLLLLAVPVVLSGHRKSIVPLLRAILLISLLVSFYSVWQHFYGQDLVRNRSLMTEWGHYESVGFFGHKLSYGGQLMLVLLVGITLALQEGFRKWRLLYLPAIALLCLVLFWSYARSAQIGLWFGLLLILGGYSGWRRWASLGLVAIPLAVLGFLPVARTHFLRLFSMENNATRLNLWESSWEGIKARPWLGFGPGNFEPMMARYEVQGFYNARSHSHNDFLMNGVNSGLFGILTGLALLLVVTFLLWRLWKSGGENAWLALACVGIQVAISVAGLFQVYQTDDEVEMMLYFLLGCGLALGGGFRRKSA
jgi:putative inorganic carbon (hco3(-)) transporter